MRMWRTFRPACRVGWRSRVRVRARMRLRVRAGIRLGAGQPGHTRQVVGLPGDLDQLRRVPRLGRRGPAGLARRTGRADSDRHSRGGRGGRGPDRGRRAGAVVAGCVLPWRRCCGAGSCRVPRRRRPRHGSRGRRCRPEQAVKRTRKLLSFRSSHGLSWDRAGEHVQRRTGLHRRCSAHHRRRLCHVCSRALHSLPCASAPSP
jgi:hypothetical protein